MSLRGLPLLQDSISRLLAQLHENEPVRLAAATAVGLVVAAKATRTIARLAAEAHDAPEGDGAAPRGARTVGETTAPSVARASS